MSINMVCRLNKNTGAHTHVQTIILSDGACTHIRTCAHTHTHMQAIILSSGACSALEVRSPAAATALLAVLAGHASSRCVIGLVCDSVVIYNCEHWWCLCLDMRA
jgi:hypothetical protein